MNRGVDATGRSGKRTGRAAAKNRPPKGAAFIWHTHEMLTSEAWLAMGVNSRRVLERVEIEHMDHGGTENGRLIVTHKNFLDFGVNASEIHPAIQELVFLGFLRYVQGGRWGGSNRPSKYRITWLPDKSEASATNEWRGVTAEQIQVWKKERTKARKARRQYRKNLKVATEFRGTKPRLSVVSGGKNAED